VYKDKRVKDSAKIECNVVLTLLFRDRLNVAILNTLTAFVAHCTFVVIFLMNVIIKIVEGVLPSSRSRHLTVERRCGECVSVRCVCVCVHKRGGV